MPLIDFNANNYEPSTGFDALPPAWYRVMITKTDLITSKNNPQNDYLKIEYTVIQDYFKNRKVFQNLNINHPKSDVAGYARADLSAIARSVGVMQVHDSNQLHNIPLEIKLTVKEDPNYGDQNIIVGYSSIDGSFTTSPGNNSAAAPAPQAQAAPAPAASNGMPAGKPWGQ